MKCPVCSHVYPDTLSRCSRCGRVAPETSQPSTPKSTLIEFPLSRQAQTSLPDWRLELNEKVRARKARRTMEALVDEAASLRQAVAPPKPVEPVPDPEPPAEPANPIVAAALDRVRRASENAARATHQVARPSAAATAAATAPVTLREHPTHLVPLPALVAAPEPRLVPDRPTLPATRRETELFDPAELLAGLDDDIGLLDLGETRLVALPGATLDEPRRASLALRAVASVVDLAVFCIVSVPFVATTYAIDGDFSKPAVLALLGSTLVLLAIFYLFSMFALCGRTIGMMFSRTHVVDVDGDTPSPRDIFLRVVGVLVSALPVGLGFAWAIFNAERCSWHDLLSGTRVVED